MQVFESGTRFSQDAILDAQSIAEFASMVGDANPLHHDASYAASTRFGGVVASGPQTSAMLMALTATYFSRSAKMVGLEFSFRFLKPVFAGENVSLEWLIVRVEKTSTAGQQVIDLRGRMTNGRNETAVGAKGRVLVAAME